MSSLAFTGSSAELRYDSYSLKPIGLTACMLLSDMVICTYTCFIVICLLTFQWRMDVTLRRG